MVSAVANSSRWRAGDLTHWRVANTPLSSFSGERAALDGDRAISEGVRLGERTRKRGRARQVGKEPCPRVLKDTSCDLDVAGGLGVDVGRCAGRTKRKADAWMTTQEIARGFEGDVPESDGRAK